MTFEINPWGKTETIKLHINTYAKGGLALTATYFDSECGCELPYATLTVYLEHTSNGCAYIDVNNCPWAIELIEKYELGTMVSSKLSGYVVYPLYKFNLGKLKKIVEE